MEIWILLGVLSIVSNFMTVKLAQKFSQKHFVALTSLDSANLFHSL